MLFVGCCGGYGLVELGMEYVNACGITGRPSR